MSDICPNCGAHHFTTKDPCKECGYSDPQFKKQGDYDLMFCNACGCHYSGSCPNHPDQCVKVTLNPTPKAKP